MSNRRIDLVIFDLDGTLIDSIVDIAGALNHVLRMHHHPAVSVDDVRRMVGDGVSMLVRRALAEVAPGGGVIPDETVNDMAQTIWQYYVDHPCVDSEPFDGMVTVLDELAARGIAIAVLTNKPGDVARALFDVLAMRSRFTDVIGDMDGFARKPSPEAVSVLMQRAGVSADRTLMVGDGIPDVGVAHAAGIASVACLWGYTPAEKLLAENPTHAIAKPQDLLALV
jgi:phosphoglycolate phosphatase